MLPNDWEIVEDFELNAKMYMDYSPDLVMDLKLLFDHRKKSLVERA
jgi:hypothetical protein